MTTSDCSNPPELAANELIGCRVFQESDWLQKRREGLCVLGLLLS